MDLYGLGRDFEMLDRAIKQGKYILFLMIIVLFCKRFIFGFSIVQGNSMSPTLRNNDKLFINKFVYFFKEPSCGDIVVFNPPVSDRENELFIKRIIAGPHDQFEIKAGAVYINNKKIKEGYICKEKYKNRIYNVTSGKVPHDMVFVMGDNRNDSNDSRCFGFVPKKNIRGKIRRKI